MKRVSKLGLERVYSRIETLQRYLVVEKLNSDFVLNNTQNNANYSSHFLYRGITLAAALQRQTRLGIKNMVFRAIIAQGSAL